MTDSETLTGSSPNGLENLIEKIGFLHYLLIIFLVPIFFIPPQLFSYATINPEIQVYKEMLTRFLCTSLICFAGILFLFRGYKPLFKTPVITISILAYVFFALISALISSGPRTSLSLLLSEALLLLCACVAPFFLRTISSVKWVVFAGMASVFVVAFFCIGSLLTGSGILSIIYGANVLDLIQSGEIADTTLEGGAERSIYMSTLGNPEYVGTFLSAGVLMIASWVWTTFRKEPLKEKPWLHIVLGCALLLFVFAAMILTKTRGGLVVVGLGFFAWLFLLSSIRMRWGGVALIATLTTLFLGGLIPAILVGVVCLALFLGISFKKDNLPSSLKSMVTYQKLLLGSVVIGTVLFGASAVFVPPVNNRIAPIVDRVTEGVSTQDRSIRERLMFYLFASEMVKDRPFLGVGPGLYSSRYHWSAVDVVEADDTGVLAYNQILLRTWVAQDAHNDYFQIASEQGLIGIALFLLMIAALMESLVKLIRYGNRQFSSVALCITVGILGYLIMMMTSFPFQENARLAFVGILLSAATALSSAFYSEQST